MTRIRRLTRLDRLHDRVAALDDDAAYYAALGAAVAERRVALALSQKELADLCATSQPAIARLEAGAQAPRVDTLRRIAHALDCELELGLRPRTKGANG